MLDQGREDADCDCGWMSRAVGSAGYPIRFDPRMHEYHLLVQIGDQEGTAVLRFCPNCGTRLPQSQRESFFTEPSDEDTTELKAMIAGIKTRDDLFDVLGSPSHEVDCPPPKPIRQWVKQYTYSDQWGSLDLFVQELVDGSLEFMWGGKYCAAP